MHTKANNIINSSDVTYVSKSQYNSVFLQAELEASRGNVNAGKGRKQQCSGAGIYLPVGGEEGRKGEVMGRQRVCFRGAQRSEGFSALSIWL